MLVRKCFGGIVTIMGRKVQQTVQTVTSDMIPHLKKGGGKRPKQSPAKPQVPRPHLFARLTRRWFTEIQEKRIKTF